MGVVYHARDPMLERDVALKVMLPQIAGDPDQKGRFEREARAVAKIVHPNVLTVFDLGYQPRGFLRPALLPAQAAQAHDRTQLARVAHQHRSAPSVGRVQATEMLFGHL